MKTYLESLFLFFLCSIIYFNDATNLYQHIYSILAFSLICFEFICMQSKAFVMIGCCVIILSFINPMLLIYVPAFIYLFLYQKNYNYPFLFIALCFLFLPIHDPLEIILFLSFTFLSIYLAWQSRKHTDLEHAILILRDTTTEHELMLKKKEQELLEKKNDELYIATLQERNRIAREIHDNVGHMLSRSILQLGALLAICKDDTVTPHLSILKNTLNEAMNSIRNSVHDLHDEAIKLDSAIQELIQAFEFCPIKFTYQMSTNIPKNVKYCFLAIIKEALNNIMKHSNATQASVNIKEHHSFYQLIIKDNGMSCNTNPETQSTNGIGLTSMRERVSMNNGIMHISNDNGYRIFVTIPK